MITTYVFLKYEKATIDVNNEGICFNWGKNNGNILNIAGTDEQLNDLAFKINAYLQDKDMVKNNVKS